MTNNKTPGPFHSTKEEIAHYKHKDKPIHDRYFTLAFRDIDFLLREELRPVRVQLELLRPELVLQDNKIEEAMVFFGSARLPSPEDATILLRDAQLQLKQDPNNKTYQHALFAAERVMDNSRYLAEATKLAKIVSENPKSKMVVYTGGGPSFMEAANKGAHLANKPSVALNMTLPSEQIPNPYVTPELCFQFHYFSIRKMHFLIRARALAAFPGGFGTMDELFEVLTLMQTHKIDRIPLFLFNEKFWRRVVNFEAFVDEGTINADDLELIRYVETAEEAWQYICEFYNL